MFPIPTRIVKPSNSYETQESFMDILTILSIRMIL